MTRNQGDGPTVLLTEGGERNPTYNNNIRIYAAASVAEVENQRRAEEVLFTSRRWICGRSLVVEPHDNACDVVRAATCEGSFGQPPRCSLRLFLRPREGDGILDKRVERRHGIKIRGLLG